MSWLSWHLAVRDGTPFYTTVSLRNRMHAQPLTHTHTLRHLQPRHAGGFSPVSKITRAKGTQRKEKTGGSHCRGTVKGFMLYAQCIPDIYWVDGSELLSSQQVSKLPWKVSVVTHQQRTSGKHLVCGCDWMKRVHQMSLTRGLMLTNLPTHLVWQVWKQGRLFSFL